MPSYSVPPQVGEAFDLDPEITDDQDVHRRGRPLISTPRCNKEGLRKDIDVSPRTHFAVNTAQLKRPLGHAVDDLDNAGERETDRETNEQRAMESATVQWH